ncbi:hypothetical protein WMY93_026422 [Mugilogobius chulae]|uniref:Tubulin-specific chaperone A n=1 Tax=Mugilogobius chulae TaxID=88201 RepID=A0AAW0MXI2_9GOBI
MVSVASFALMKVRLKELSTEEKKDKFLGVKLRVADDVLTEYQTERETTEKKIEEENSVQEKLKQEIADVAASTKKAELDSCEAVKKTTTDENTSMQEQLKL